MITIKKEHHEQDWHDIREQVFMKEQGFSQEFDDTDNVACHVVLYQNDKAIGCGRTFGSDEGAKEWTIGRVAILQAYRKCGYGYTIIEALEAEAKAHGACSTHLSAQLQAQAFYERCGYQSYGDIHMDEHVPHIMMKKML